MKTIRDLKDDARALNKFISAQQGWIRAIARRYRLRGVEVDDLVQEGNIMLLELIDSYDPNQHEEFKAYAYKRVKGRIKNALNDLLGLSAYAEVINIDDDSLNEGNHTFAELIEDPTPRTDETMDQRSVDDILRDMMDLLTEKEKQVIQLRFGIGGNDDGALTMFFIAQKLGVNVRTVNRHLTSALKTLRKSPLSIELLKALHPYNRVTKIR